MPGFFNIELDTKLHDGFEWNDFNSQEKATLVHEYIHYLQDISTTQGLANYNYLVEYINLYLYKIYHSEKVITIPIDLESCQVENAYLQTELRGIYSGSDKNIKIHHINKIIREVEECYKIQFNTIDNNENDMFNINIYYDDKDVPYAFGNTCITESMAYLIETHIFPIDIRKKEFPYNACEMLCEVLYPEIAKKYSCIVAMCDISLMHYHSGDFFYHLVMDMKNNDFLPKSSADIYEYTNARIPHLYENFLSMFENAIGNSNLLYSKDNEITNPINMWLLDKLEKGMGFRLWHCNFISKIMEFKDASIAERYFLWLISIFNLPLIIDKEKSVFSSQDGLALLLAPIALVELFSKPNCKKCYLYDFCIANKTPQVDNLCLSEPWLQTKKEKLCPLALYWYKFSLEDKIIKK